jgi:hypothetical protein
MNTRQLGLGGGRVLDAGRQCVTHILERRCGVRRRKGDLGEPLAPIPPPGPAPIRCRQRRASADAQQRAA